MKQENIKTPVVVVIDSREQLPWVFKKSIRKKLATGDYSLLGLEETHCVERKGSMSEFAHNLTEKRFEYVCQRMNAMESAVVILEFEKQALVDWPENAGLTPSQIAKVRTTAKFLRRRLHELEEKYPNVKFIFAGEFGRESAVEEFQKWLKSTSEE